MLIGIDEVGRGCWAGPLVAAAVGLAKPINGLGDSKILSALKRINLDQQIRSSSAIIGVGWVWPAEINEIGLSRANALAMNRALQQIVINKVTAITIDGKVNLLKKYPELTDSRWKMIVSKSKAVIGADSQIAEVSAASIIAKVARDDYMKQLSLEYPEYGFSQHVGYGTKHHQQALELHGVLPLVHRLTYKPIKALINA